VTTQFEAEGIVFSGQAPFITDDESSSTNPVISGSPLFAGTIVGSFVVPGTSNPSTVDEFSLNVGYINNPGSVIMTVLGEDGNQLGVLTANQYGFNQLTSWFPGAASFIVSQVADEPAGWEINTIQFAGSPTSTSYLALGDSFSSGEGTNQYSWSVQAGDTCDRGPDAWPVHLATDVNTGLNNPELSIPAANLIACKSERTFQIDTPENNEEASELQQVKNFIGTNEGPPELLTITIGGDDLGWAGVLGSCFTSKLTTCSNEIYAFAQKAQAKSFVQDLENVYSAIIKAGVPAQDIVAVSYPDLFPQPGWLNDINVNQHCYPLFKGDGGLLAALNTAEDSLNSSVATAAGDEGVPFADTSFATSGHELCTGDSWFNALTFHNKDNGQAGHPNSCGQEAIADAVALDLGLQQGALCPGADGILSAAERPSIAVPTDIRANLAGSSPSIGATKPGGPERARDGTARTALTEQGTARQLEAAVSPALGVTTSQLLEGLPYVPYTDYLDAAGGTAPYNWAISSGQLPRGLVLDPSTGTITGAPTIAGTYSFSVAVSDSSSPQQVANASLAITVDPVSAVAIGTTSLPEATADQAYSTEVQATGGLGSYTWSVASGQLPAGLSLDPSTGMISGVPQAPGATTFTVEAADGSSPALTASARFSLSVAEAGSPLSVATSSLPSTAQGDDYSAPVYSVGGLGLLQWQVASGALPAGLALDPSTGVISGEVQEAGIFNFTVQVTDQSQPPLGASASLSITSAPASALAVQPLSAGDGATGTYFFEAPIAEGGVAPYSWTLSSGQLPPGLSIDPVSGDITGTPTTAGDYSFTLSVSDGSQPSAQSLGVPGSIDITQPPLALSSSLAQGTESEYYTANVAASGGTAPYTWALVSGSLPNGVSFDSSTGAITGVPTQAGNFPISVQVTDSTGPSPQSLTADLSLTVAPAPALAITTTSLASATLDVPYAAALGYDGGTAPYTWAVLSGQLPPGLSLDPASGMITGTPSATGTYPVTISATDSTSPTAETASLSTTIAVSPTPSLALPTSTLPDATQGQPYSTSLTSSGGVSPITWGVSGGALPTGLVLDPSSGALSGEPSQTGTFTATVTATDSSTLPETASTTISLTVDASPPLNFVTGGLDLAAQGDAYNAQLDAGGGSQPYTWSVADGSLPAGLALDPTNGAISGTPTSFGTNLVTFEVDDASNPPQSAQVTLPVVVEGNASVAAVPTTSTTSSTTTSTTAPTTSPGGGGSGGGFPPVAPTITTTSTTTSTTSPASSSSSTTTTAPATRARSHAQPVVVALTKSATVHKATVGLRLSCRSATCRGTIRLWYRDVALGQRAYALLAGKTATFPVRLGAAAMAFLSKAKGHEIRAAETIILVGGKAVRPHVRLSR